MRAQFFAGDRIFFKGYADYGWITSGQFSLNTGTIQGDLKGNIADGSIAMGYEFYPLKCLQVGPTVGWSYEKIYAFTRNTTTSGVATTHQNIKTQLGGPFLGVETNFDIKECVQLFAGYELHLAVSKIRLETATTTTKGHLRNLVGNLAHIGFSYKINSLWNVGIDLLGYTYRSYQRGTISPSSITGTETDRSLDNIRVTTGEVRLFTGLQF